MKSITKNALPRDRLTCVKKSYYVWLRHTVLRYWRNRNAPHIKDITPRLARDAGLTEAQIAQHQHRWPSETMHRPRL